MSQQQIEMREAVRSRYTGEQPIGVLMVSTFSDKHGAAVGESLGPEAVAGDIMGHYGGSVVVDHVDFQLDPLIPDLAERVKQERPYILGIGVKIGAHDQASKLVHVIDALPLDDSERPLIVMGGVLPTFAGVDILRRHPHIIMAQKEGEPAMRGIIDFIRGEKELDQVPGLLYINGDGGMHMRPAVRHDISSRHLPARITTKRISDELNGMVWAEASRGCSYNCTFCSVREIHGGGFEGDISPESVVADLLRLRDLGIGYVAFTDDDFGGDPERTLEIAELLIANGSPISFSVSTRADHIYDELGRREKSISTADCLDQHNQRLRYIMERLHQAGLVRVFIGMESGSPTQLRRYGKQVSVAGNYKALEILSDIGIDVVAGFIPVDQLMTLVELQENLHFLRDTKMWKKVSNPLSVLRVQAGSPYLRLMQQRGLVGDQTEDLVFYDAQFADPAVQRVAKIADRWVQDNYALIFGLKTVEATVALDGAANSNSVHANVVRDRLIAFRELEMCMIEAITGALLEDPKANLSGIVNDFQQERAILVSVTVAMIEAGTLGGNGRLIEAIKGLGGKC